MDLISAALAVAALASLALALFAIRRAVVAEQLAARALSRISDMSLEDKVKILPNGRVRVDGLRGDHFHVVFLGEPEEGRN